VLLLLCVCCVVVRHSHDCMVLHARAGAAPVAHGPACAAIALMLPPTPYAPAAFMRCASSPAKCCRNLSASSGPASAKSKLLIRRKHH